MRKFYIIAHNPDTPDSAITALQSGANALEPDIYYNLRRFLSFIIFFLCFGFAHSQNVIDSTKSNVKGIIELNYLQILFGEFRITYEKPIKNNISLEFGAGFIFGGYYGLIDYSKIDRQLAEGYIPTLPDFSYDGFSIRSGIKLYTSYEFNHKGIYWEPLIFLKNYYYHDNSFFPPATGKIFIFGFQSLIGYKFPSKKKFSYEIYCGFGIRRTLQKYDYHQSGIPNNIENNEFNSITPQLGFTVGYYLYKK
jgi:hypothetical protein